MPFDSLPGYDNWKTREYADLTTCEEPPLNEVKDRVYENENFPSLEDLQAAFPHATERDLDRILTSVAKRV